MPEPVQVSSSALQPGIRAECRDGQNCASPAVSLLRIHFQTHLEAIDLTGTDLSGCAVVTALVSQSEPGIGRQAATAEGWEQSLDVACCELSEG